MKSSSRSAYLFNLVFLGGLLLLIVNDHYLKQDYGNWFTGKLSDFAGILILPLFLKYLTGWRDDLLVLITVVFFAWFKSPLSSAALDYYNSFSPISLGRVVDYSDLLAFVVLPVTWRVLRAPDPFTFNLPDFPRRAVVRFAVFPLAFLAFVATDDDTIFPFEDGSSRSCCEQPPVDVPVGNGYVYLPTAFTPDGDGRNDSLWLVADANIVRLDSFVVLDLQTSAVVWRVDSLTDLSSSGGFGGEAARGEAASYFVVFSVVAADGTERTFFNEVCALPCPTTNGEEPAFVPECTFGNQVNAAGRFDRTVDSGETLSCY